MPGFARAEDKPSQAHAGGFALPTAVKPRLGIAMVLFLKDV